MEENDTEMPGDLGDAARAAPAPVAARLVPRREGHPVRLLLVVVITTAVILGVIYQRVYKRRTALLKMQQAALTYSRPADQVAYEEAPARAAELLEGTGRNPEYVSVPTGDAGPPVAGHVPGAWAPVWRWARPDGPSEPPAGAVLFLGERQTVLGKRGLVCVQADRVGRRLRVTFVHPGATTLDPVAVTDVAVAPRPQEGLMILTAGADPFGAKLPPADAHAGGDATGGAPPAAAARADLRFFAGQPDPKDPTHLTIGFRSAGRSGEVDLWVQDERTIHYGNRMLSGK